MKIDAHTHVGTGAAIWTGAQTVERMDTVGVDKTVIFPFTEGFFHNRDIPGFAEAFPDRLIPFCAVNPWEGKGACEELESCYKNHFKGVKTAPNVMWIPLK